MLRTAILLTAFLATTQLFANPLPDFQLRWRNNTADTNLLWKSAEHNNAVYVIEAYFKNCPACNENAPQVNAFATKFANDPRVKVLDVSRDCRDSDYAFWIQRHQPNHPVLDDCAERDQQVLSPLGVIYYPTTIVLDCNLNEVYRTVGTWDVATRNELTEAVNVQLAVGCTR